MKTRMTKLICILLCLLFCLTLLPACRRADPLAQNGIREVSLIKKGKMDILVTMNASTLEAHKKQTVCLYELFPGEKLSDLADKDPVAEKKANGSIKFRIPVEENGINRLYSTFVVAFSDGTLLSEKTVGVKNPEFLATVKDRFPWVGTQKGYLNKEGVEDGWQMGATHTVVSVKLSDLLTGSDTLRFNDRQHSYSGICLNDLIARVSEATRTGMQTSLELVLDAQADLETVTALLEQMGDRFCEDVSQGFVSAYVISPAQGASASYAADVAQLARLSLLSRVSQGRIYLHLGNRSYSDTVAYFSLLSEELSHRGFSQWGAMITPTCRIAPWESGAEDEVSVDKLPTLFKALNDLSLSPSYLAVSGLSYSAADEDLQAAMVAYAYRLAVGAGANEVYYEDGGESAYRLFTEDGSLRRAGRVFATMDLELSSEDLATVDALSLGNYAKLSETVSRRALTGDTTLGSDGQKNTVLFDFSKNDTNGFSAVNGLSAPICEASASMGYPVLYTWLKATAQGGEGVRTIRPNGQELENAFSISLRLLLQNLETPTSKITLRLDGVAKNSAEHITFEATVEMNNDARWQTAIFYVGGFASEIDLSQPYVMTVYADTDSPEGTEYLMWLDTVDIRKPEKDMGPLMTLLIVLGAAVLGFGVIFLLYKLSSKKKRAAKYRR